LISGLHEEDGVVESIDGGAIWSLADGGERPEAVVWGTAKKVHAMYAWACSNCDPGTNLESAAQPGTDWAPAAVPPELVIGPNGVVVTSDGTRNIFVGLMGPGTLAVH
jgi:hypothetical protein